MGKLSKLQIIAKHYSRCTIVDIENIDIMYVTRKNTVMHRSYFIHSIRQVKLQNNIIIKF